MNRLPIRFVWLSIAALSVISVGCERDAERRSPNGEQLPDVTQSSTDTHLGPPACAPQTGAACALGQYLPAFSLFDCAGNAWNIHELLRSHDRALLYFMASWFDPIGSDPIAVLNVWHQEYGNTIRFVVVLREEEGGFGVSNTEVCTSWSKRNNAQFLVLIDPDDQLTSACLDNAIPTAVAVDCEGTVFYQSSILPGTDSGQPPI